jgi:hypothetical protein
VQAQRELVELDRARPVEYRAILRAHAPTAPERLAEPIKHPVVPHPRERERPRRHGERRAPRRERVERARPAEHEVRVQRARAEERPRAAHGEHARGLRVRVHRECQDRGEELGWERAEVGHGEPDIR